MSTLSNITTANIDEGFVDSSTSDVDTATAMLTVYPAWGDAYIVFAHSATLAHYGAVDISDIEGRGTWEHNMRTSSCMAQRDEDGPDNQGITKQIIKSRGPSSSIEFPFMPTSPKRLGFYPSNGNSTDYGEYAGIVATNALSALNNYATFALTVEELLNAYESGHDDSEESGNMIEIEKVHDEGWSNLGESDVSNYAWVVFDWEFDGNPVSHVSVDITGDHRYRHLADPDDYWIEFDVQVYSSDYDIEPNDNGNKVEKNTESNSNVEIVENTFTENIKQLDQEGSFADFLIHPRGMTPRQRRRFEIEEIPRNEIQSHELIMGIENEDIPHDTKYLYYSHNPPVNVQI